LSVVLALYPSGVRFYNQLTVLHRSPRYLPYA